ncbi:MAG TPA: hypothetical protein VHY35_05985 [Stellaceae bacterium]|nr:hypothetical protein [Stellaceae bacterium]
MALEVISSTSAASDRAARWLADWDGQGTHRTATAGDHAGAEWLAVEARALGADAVIEEFALDRLDPVATFLEIGDKRIAAVPVFDAPPTSAGGVTGRLGVAGSGAPIIVAELSPRTVYSGEFERLRRTGEQTGFVVVCVGEQPGMGLINAESFRRPYGAPAIHIASEAGDIVLAAAQAGAEARLVADSRRTPAQGRNVVAVLGGDLARPPLVVMTPRSSWWHSTAERGGGIVCWLETLRALVAMPMTRPVVLTANSGHELNHLGLDDFVERRPGWDRAAADGGALWVHYGANIGAAGGNLSVMSADDALRDLATAELSRQGQSFATTAKNIVPSGETRDIHRTGGRYLTLVGTNPLFHLPQDRWPHSIDLPAVIRCAAAAARIVTTLAG